MKLLLSLLLLRTSMSSRLYWLATPAQPPNQLASRPSGPSRSSPRISCLTKWIAIPPKFISMTSKKRETSRQGCHNYLGGCLVRSRLSSSNFKNRRSLLLHKIFSPPFPVNSLWIKTTSSRQKSSQLMLPLSPAPFSRVMGYMRVTKLSNPFSLLSNSSNFRRKKWSRILRLTSHYLLIRKNRKGARTRALLRDHKEPLQNQIQIQQRKEEALPSHPNRPPRRLSLIHIWRCRRRG